MANLVIKDERFGKKIRLSELTKGEIFSYVDDVFIKINDFTSVNLSACYIVDGTIALEALVTPLKATLIIE